jgi:uncharacterized protein YkwD
MSRVRARLAGAESAYPRDRPSPTRRLRKVLVIGGAAVFFAAFYLRVASRAGFAGRALIGLVFGGFLVAAAALGSSFTPRAVAHLPASFDPAAVSGSISPIQTGWGVSQPIVIHFSAPMAADSVESVLRVSPRADVRLEWDASGSQLYVTPIVGWTSGTVYSVTVGPGARSQSGAALAPMAPAIVYVRPAATAAVEATKLVGDRIGLESGFRLTFSRAVDLAGLRDAFTISPAADGTFAFEGSAGSMPDVVWVPDAPLKPNTTYTVSLGSSAVDLEGAPVADPPSLTVRTVSRPSVVRFRPRNKEDQIDPAQVLSVRFTEAMDRKATRVAYHLYAVDKAGKRSEVDLSKAKTSWAEGDTVLVIDPAKALLNGTTYVAEVAPSARSSLGAAISDDAEDVATATFTVVPKAASATTAPTAPKTSPPPSTSTGGGTSTAPWLDAEKYYLKMMNCIHTGGTLHNDGSCTGYGSNGNSPLILDPTLSTCASRPWAKYLADTYQLYHGDVGGRFAKCGYNVNWGENVSWNTYDVFYGVIHTSLYFQAEKSYGGHHYLNLINPRFTHVGVGIWREGGRNWFVTDFWGTF